MDAETARFSSQSKAQSLAVSSTEEKKECKIPSIKKEVSSF